MIISRAMNFIGSKLTTMPRINYQDYKPKNFQPDAYDIGKIYHLNKWLMENSPKPKDEYK
jgi:hypothetical protein